MLEAALTRLADVVADWRKDDLRDRPGAEAAGGLGFGLMAFCGAEVHRGFDEVAELLRLAEAIAGADPALCVSAPVAIVYPVTFNPLERVPCLR